MTEQRMQKRLPKAEELTTAELQQLVYQHFDKHHKEIPCPMCARHAGLYKIMQNHYGDTYHCNRCGYTEEIPQ